MCLDIKLRREAAEDLGGIKNVPRFTPRLELQNKRPRTCPISTAGDAGVTNGSGVAILSFRDALCALGWDLREAKELFTAFVACINDCTILTLQLCTQCTGKRKKEVELLFGT